MIQGLAGKLNKTPEIITALQIPGKTGISFTIAENVDRGKEKPKSTNWWNITMFASSEAQTNMFLGLEKGVVVSFSGVKITGCKGSEKDGDGNNSIYARANSLEILGGGSRDAGGESTPAARPATPASASRSTPNRAPNSRQTPPRAATEVDDDLTDPFIEN